MAHEAFDALEDLPTHVGRQDMMLRCAQELVWNRWAWCSHPKASQGCCWLGLAMASEGM